MEEINFEGEVSDNLKREIDCLVDAGFDPERELEQNRLQYQQQQREFNLLLPQSCMPTIGEIATTPGDRDNPASIAEVEAYLEKTILDLPPSSTFLLDFRDRNHLVAAEIVLTRLKEHMSNNYIRFSITKEMKESVRRAQQESWANQARYN